MAWDTSRRPLGMNETPVTITRSFVSTGLVSPSAGSLLTKATYQPSSSRVIPRIGVSSLNPVRPVRIPAVKIGCRLSGSKSRTPSPDNAVSSSVRLRVSAEALFIAHRVRRPSSMPASDRKKSCLLWMLAWLDRCSNVLRFRRMNPIAPSRTRTKTAIRRADPFSGVRSVRGMSITLNPDHTGKDAPSSDRATSLFAIGRNTGVRKGRHRGAVSGRLPI